jgi:hypothetical protein
MKNISSQPGSVSKAAGTKTETTTKHTNHTKKYQQLAADAELRASRRSIYTAHSSVVLGLIASSALVFCFPFVYFVCFVVSGSPEGPKAVHQKMRQAAQCEFRFGGLVAVPQ